MYHRALPTVSVSSDDAGPVQLFVPALVAGLTAAEARTLAAYLTAAVERLEALARRPACTYSWGGPDEGDTCTETPAVLYTLPDTGDRQYLCDRHADEARRDTGYDPIPDAPRADVPEPGPDGDEATRLVRFGSAHV